VSILTAESVAAAGNGVPELADEREVFGQDCDSLCMDGGEVNVLVGGGRRRERGRSKKYRKKERKRKKEKTIPSRGTYCEQEDNEFLRGRLHRLESDYGEP
jgi:hypothetical protein